MRRKMVLGVGLAGILGGSAVGQFAGNQPPARPSGFAAGQPVGTPSPGPAAPAPAGGYVAPVGGFQPAGGTPNPGVAPAALTQPPLPAVEIPTALGPNHPLAVRPEHGNYFIHVKSYSRPHRPDPNDPGRSARELAEG